MLGAHSLGPSAHCAVGRSDLRPVGPWAGQAWVSCWLVLPTASVRGGYVTAWTPPPVGRLCPAPPPAHRTPPAPRLPSPPLTCLQVMHLLLLELLKQQPAPAPDDSTNSGSSTTLLEFMRLDEFLIDIGDDLTDYEDDVVANSFNIFRGYVYLFGREAPPQLVRVSCTGRKLRRCREHAVTRGLFGACSSEVCKGSWVSLSSPSPLLPCVVAQAARISQLEAQRSRLLGQLPSSVRAHVVKRQQDAVEEEGECGVAACSQGCDLLVLGSVCRVGRLKQDKDGDVWVGVTPLRCAGCRLQVLTSGRFLSSSWTKSSSGGM